MSCSLQSKGDPYGLKESHTNPHPPTQTHTPAWNISSVKVSRMNALNDGNVDVKTTSIQKAKCKGPTKEATGTTRKWKEEDTWESPSVVFSTRILERRTSAHKDVIPQNSEEGKRTLAQRKEEWRQHPARRWALRSMLEEIQSPRHGGHTQHKKELNATCL